MHLLVLVAFPLACSGGSPTADTGATPDTAAPDTDADGDGWTTDAGDCDDADATISPGATEVCDGVDQDCDGAVDEDATDATTWYLDADGDGAGDPTVTTLACSPPYTYVAFAGDCYDTDPSVVTCDPVILHPSAGASVLGGVFPAGDLDGDGEDDLVAGDQSGAWFVSVPTSGEYAVDTIAFASADAFGAAADVTGDGISDAAWKQQHCVEEPEGSYTYACTSSVHLARGPFSGTVTEDLAFTWAESEIPSEQPWSAVVMGGDLDADGIGDLVYAEGASGGMPGTPHFWLVPTAASGTLAETDLLQIGGEWTDFPSAMDMPGDLDGDGLDDLVVESMDDVAAIVLGPFGSGYVNDEQTLFRASRLLGHADVDGDGRVDLLLGGSRDAASTVHVVPWAAGSGNVEDFAWMTVTAPSAYGYGFDAAVFGDVDGDGASNLVLSSEEANNGSAASGGVWVFDVPAAGTFSTADADTYVTAPSTTDRFGSGLVLLPDRGADGASDVVVYAADPAWVFPSL